MNIIIRPIEPADNPALAALIRLTLEEFGVARAGTVYYDPSTDALCEFFQRDKAAYYVAVSDGKIIGGAGIYPTDGLPADTCELVRMYLAPAARGLGMGKKLLELCLEQAREFGFGRIYLETLHELNAALKFYKKMGFRYLNAPLGNSGHFGCPLWMLREVE
jgi:putative acetyltransferase